MPEYFIKSGFFDRQRRLFLSDNYLEWEGEDLRGQEHQRINKSDLIDFKCGMDSIEWYEFIVGRKYSFSFKDKKENELKIQFRSYFWMNNEAHHKYTSILDDVWSLYLAQLVDKSLERFDQHNKIEIQGIKLNDDGILLRTEKGFIPWNKVAIKDYHRYFAIYHRDNANIHSRVSYNEWGTEILWSCVKTILKEREASNS